jgi:septal ring-binding cell division protein DamX
MQNKAQAATEYMLLIAGVIVLVLVVISVVYYINAQQKSSITEQTKNIKNILRPQFCGNKTWDSQLEPPEPCEYTFDANITALQCASWKDTNYSNAEGYKGTTCTARCLCE